MENIYIDTNVFLVFLKKEENFNHAKAILQKVATGNGRGFISPFTLHELLWVLEKERVSCEKAISALDFVIHHPNLSFLTPSTNTFYSALDIKRKKGLKIADSLHVAIMLENNIKKIASFDSDFDRIEGIDRVSGA
ncbi:MAG: type II toxin-antitoxin system VapC family toxin [Methanosarcinales archaeon Met12]|nr:MAG: type II toxin-antitoxin system VapC family toxin [Methanosarcinales archaeon Met12]